jgi:hypothetical protein
MACNAAARCAMLEPMIPIAALAENQTWDHGEYRVYAQSEGDRIAAWIMTVGRDGDLAANPAEEAWVDAATVGVEGARRDYGPRWTMTPDAWRTIATRLDLWLSLRQLRYEESRPELAALLAAELEQARGRWSAVLYWIFSPTDAVMFEVDGSGSLAITGGDPHLDALREHTGLTIEAPTPLHRRRIDVEPSRALSVFERVASWSPQTLSWVQAAIAGVRSG